MKSNQPIGIFDSGVGGLSVLKHIHHLLPQEKLLYIADSGYAPYGCQGDDFIEQRSRIITEYLIKQGAKVIVIACNTATASIIEHFRRQYGMPFIGVEPGIKPAIEISDNGRIGVMATAATLSSVRYSRLSKRFAEGVYLYHQACPGLADQVEAGLLDNSLTRDLLVFYLNALKQKSVDTIVLGCTHYSFLSRQIRAISGEKINLVDTSSAVAEQLARILTQERLHTRAQTGSINYYTTGEPERVQASIYQLLSTRVQVCAV